MDSFVADLLVSFPRTGTYEPDLGYFIYPIAKTPFVLIYDFDDAEHRLQLIVHNRDDRSQLDPARLVWTSAHAPVTKRHVRASSAAVVWDKLPQSA